MKLSEVRPDSISSTKQVGARYATRVRVASPQGSRYDGLAGVVTRVLWDGTVFVRLQTGATRPFGLGELEVTR